MNINTKRIERIDRIRTAYIMYRGIAIATISEESNELDGDFDWVIRPIWENWTLCKEKFGVDVSIAGIDETLHKEEYIRRYVPYFVEQRTIPDGRKDLFPLLDKIGLTWNDLFEVMCRTHAICGNDDLYVSRTPDKYVDVNVMAKDFKYDIPEDGSDGSDYGWLDEPILSEDYVGLR